MEDFHDAIELAVESDLSSLGRNGGRVRHLVFALAGALSDDDDVSTNSHIASLPHFPPSEPNDLPERCVDTMRYLMSHSDRGAKMLSTGGRRLPKGEMPAVLLVEPEPSIAQPMTKTLSRKYRVCVAARAIDALEQLQRGGIDGVVAGDRLGGECMGRQLLQAVARFWPRVVRVLLSDEDAERMLAATVGPSEAHAVIGRHRGPADVEAELDRLFELQRCRT
jgi:hypothetical protein